MKNRALLRSNSISGLGGVLASFLFIKENLAWIAATATGPGWFSNSCMTAVGIHISNRKPKANHDDLTGTARLR